MAQVDSHRQGGAAARTPGGGQRGYNLVEMMIALVVLGLLLGGSLVPLRIYYEQKQMNELNEYMEKSRDAVVSYAVKNRTAAGRIEYHDTLIYDLPAGRPYLPCPDVTGDGLEDRVAVTVAVAVTVDIATLSGEGGKCEENKGILPWKTLGLEPADPWGNHLTYRVDPAFADQLLGFDETFYADMFDRRLSMTVTAGNFAERASRNDMGAIVCRRFIDHDAASGGGCPDVSLGNVLAGVVSADGVTLPARVIPGYDSTVFDATTPSGLINGAVFVILSHGGNGRGAVSHATGRCRTAPAASATGGDLTEIANAYYRMDHVLVTTSINCAPPPLTPVTDDILYENQFVQAPPTSTADDYDDVVIWMGNQELLGVLLRGGMLPIEKLEFLPQ